MHVVCFIAVLGSLTLDMVDTFRAPCKEYIVCKGNFYYWICVLCVYVFSAHALCLCYLK